jgi:hypothetical protein
VSVKCIVWEQARGSNPSRTKNKKEIIWKDKEKRCDEGQSAPLGRLLPSMRRKNKQQFAQMIERRINKVKCIDVYCYPPSLGEGVSCIAYTSSRVGRTNEFEGKVVTGLN